MNKGKVALFADIHSNYYAFKACFESAILNGAESFVFLGDYVSDFADTRKTMDLLYEIKEKYNCYFLRGNRERYMLERRNRYAEFRKGSKEGSLLYTYKQLVDADLDFFETLKISDRINLFGTEFEIVHSLMDNDRHYFEKKDDFISSVFSKMSLACFLTAHSHKQYLQKDGYKTIINPGSVGLPRDYNGLSQYAVLNIDNGDVQCEFYQIKYDLKALINSQFESGIIDYAKYWAISVLYDVITGKEYTMKLLHTVLEQSNDNGGVFDESLWKQMAKKLSIKFDKKDIFLLSEKNRK